MWFVITLLMLVCYGIGVEDGRHWRRDPTQDK